jgi:hypothetical protein
MFDAKHHVESPRSELTFVLQEMVTRYEFMHQQYQALVNERDRDRAWLTAWQNEKLQYDKKHNCILREMVILSLYTPSTNVAVAN